jgi:hypothetical protein
LKNDGTGTFSELPSLPPQAAQFQLQDLNGDGRDDLVLSGSNPSIRVRFSNGDGTFGPPIDTDLGFAIGLLAEANIDFDGDGVPDLVGGTATQLVFLHGNGDGTFTNAGTAPQPPGGLLTVANIDNVPPVDLVGHSGIIYRAGNQSRTDTWAMYATDVRDATGDGHRDVLGVGFHFFDAPQTHAVFVLENHCH